MAKVIPGWLPEEFERLNREHFQNTLPPLIFYINRMGGQFATYAPRVNIVWFHPRTLDQPRAFVSDTLLHELVHHALAHENGDPDQAHSDRFIGIANRIGKDLGLSAVEAGSTQAIEWPQSVRPKGYHGWI